MKEKKNRAEIPERRIRLGEAAVWTAVLIAGMLAIGNLFPQTKIGYKLIGQFVFEGAFAVLLGVRLSRAPAAAEDPEFLSKAPIRAPRSIRGPEEIVRVCALSFFTIDFMNRLVKLIPGLAESGQAAGVYLKAAGSVSIGAVEPAGGDAGAVGGAPLNTIFLIALFGIIASVAEELLFRGVVFRTLRTEGGAGFWPAAVVSAVLWGVFHGNPAQAAAACGIGIVFALIYEVYRNLGVVTAVHIVNNVAALIGPRVYYWISGSSWQSGRGAADQPILLMAEAVIVVWLIYNMMTGRRPRGRLSR